MKRIVSALLSAALAVSSASVINVSAADYGDGKNLVLLGDSVAAGYGLSEQELNYGQICADYLGGSVENYAHSGDETDDLLNVISNFSEEQKTAAGNADVIVISIGGNDLMQEFAKEFLKYALTKGLLTEQYSSLTEADIDAIEKLDLLSLMKGVIDEEKAKAFALGDPITFVSKLNVIGNGINKGLTANTIIPNIQQAVSSLKEINPDAKIIVQTIYNPIQFEEGYFEKIGKGENYAKAIDNVRKVFRNILESFNTQLAGVEGIEIADIYTDFSSKDDNGREYSWYFTKMQAPSRAEMDIHPTQAGHLAIAANIIGVIGEKNDDGSKLRQLYNNLSDKESYPAAALASYENVCGTYSLGDLNDDGKIDSTDASSVLREYSLASTEKPTSFTDAQKKAGNVDGSGSVDATDASTLLRYYSYTSTGGTDTLKQFLQKH